MAESPEAREPIPSLRRLRNQSEQDQSSDRQDDAYWQTVYEREARMNFENRTDTSEFTDGDIRKIVEECEKEGIIDTNKLGQLIETRHIPELGQAALVHMQTLREREAPYREKIRTVRTTTTVRVKAMIEVLRRKDEERKKKEKPRKPKYPDYPDPKYPDPKDPKHPVYPDPKYPDPTPPKTYLRKKPEEGLYLYGDKPKEGPPAKTYVPEKPAEKGYHFYTKKPAEVPPAEKKDESQKRRSAYEEPEPKKPGEKFYYFQRREPEGDE